MDWGGAERVLLDFLASVRTAQPTWPLCLIAGADGPLLAEAAALGSFGRRAAAARARGKALGDSRPDAAPGLSTRLRTYTKLAAGAGALSGYLLRLRRANSPHFNLTSSTPTVKRCICWGRWRRRNECP